MSKLHLVAFAPLLCTFACGSVSPAPTPSASQSSPSSSKVDVVQDLRTAPTVSFVASNGNRVTIHEGTFVIGTDEIGTSIDGHRTTPVATPRKDLLRRHDYAGLFSAVSPAGAPLPAELAALQARHPVIAAVTATALAAPETNESGNPLADGVETRRFVGGSINFPPVPSTWCGNGCCDSNWTGIICSQNAPFGLSWFDLNYIWATVSTSQTYEWDSLVCPVEGVPSRFDVIPSDSSLESVFDSVAVGQWQAWDIAANTPPCNGQDFCEVYAVSSQVNDSSNNQRSATYCGGLSWL